jgi:hypothetical protein
MYVCISYLSTTTFYTTNENFMKFIYILGFFAILFSLNSCGKNDFVEQSITDNKSIITENQKASFAAIYKSGDFLLKYRAKLVGNNTESSLQILDKKTDKVTEIIFFIDPSQPGYKLVQHTKVVEQAKTLSKSLEVSYLNGVASIFDSFREGIITDRSINSSSQMIQSLAFHRAIILAAKRSQDDCGCTPHPGYFVDKTLFLCQEDVHIDPRLYVKLLSNGGYKMNKTEETLLFFLQKNQVKNTISIDKVFDFIESKEHFMERIGIAYDYISNTGKARVSGAVRSKLVVEWCPLGKGSDWGCCGNYEGCCYYKNILCYLHDAACSASNCQPVEICFSGCKPDKPSVAE